MKKFFRLSVIVGALPVTLTNGTTADATQVMSDFNWIVNQVNANAAPLANTALVNANNNFTVVQSGQPATAPGNFPTALQVQTQAFNTLSSVLGTNTLTARSAAVPLSAYATGQIFRFFPANANTGPTTLNIDTVGQRSILNLGSALSGAELQAYQPALIAYDPNAATFDLVNGTPYVQGPNINAAATLNLDGTFGDYSQVDGTTNITAMTLSRGRNKLLEFNSSPLLSHSGTLLLGSSFVPTPGAVMGFRGEAGGVVRLTNLSRTIPSRWPQRTVITATGAGTYVTKLGCIAIDVEAWAGGGQGAQGGGATGNSGGPTTFGTITCNGGVGGNISTAGGDGGTASGGDVNIQGSAGENGPSTVGGVGPYGGSGGTTGAGKAGSGSGGAATGTGGGGGAGGYARKLFPLSGAQTSFAYVVDNGGSGAGSGASGGSGQIIITEYF